jgi:hypothetical protein
LVDDGGLAHIGSPASHHPKTYLFILLPVIFLQIAQHLPHIIVVLRTHCKTPYSVVIVILYDFVGLGSITEIVFVEDYQLLLLASFDNQIELRVSTAVWNTGISDLHEDVDLVRALFD